MLQPNAVDRTDDYFRVRAMPDQEPARKRELRDILISCAIRETSGPIAVDTDVTNAISNARRKMYKGVSIPDAMVAQTICASCGSNQGREKKIALIKKIDSDEYNTTWTWISYVLHTLDDIVVEDDIACKTCHQWVDTHVDYYSYQAARNADLVLRMTNPKATPYRHYMLLWMDENGSYTHVSTDEVPLTQAELTDEMYCAGAVERLASGDLEQCAAYLKECLKVYPQTKKLLTFAFQLIDTHKIGLAEAIAETYIHHYPTDANGYACLAQVYAKGYVNLLDTSMLELAEQKAALALSISPQCAEALLTRANCMRLRNMTPDKVAPVYNALISAFPNFGAAYYNFALLWLPYSPKKALEIFEQGAKVEPNDIEFKIGQARALSALGKHQEALERLSVAEKASPDNPFIHKVRTAILQHRRTYS